MMQQRYQVSKITNLTIFLGLSTAGYLYDRRMERERNPECPKGLFQRLAINLFGRSDIYPAVLPKKKVNEDGTITFTVPCIQSMEKWNVQHHKIEEIIRPHLNANNCEKSQIVCDNEICVYFKKDNDRSCIKVYSMHPR